MPSHAPQNIGCQQPLPDRRAQVKCRPVRMPCGPQLPGREIHQAGATQQNREQHQGVQRAGYRPFRRRHSRVAMALPLAVKRQCCTQRSPRRSGSANAPLKPSASLAIPVPSIRSATRQNNGSSSAAPCPACNPFCFNFDVTCSRPVLRIRRHPQLNPPT
jgi:hypothetical protein